jgi:Na+/melibiose symporter-like transporter
VSRAEVYPLGFLGIGLGNTLFTQWIVRFHAPPEGGRASVIGAALLVGFLVQAALNPWLGAVADRVRHPWGRRRPFVLLGAPPLVIVYLALWQRADPAWGVVTVLLYSALYVVVTQPYVALLPSIAPAGPLRVRFTLTGAMLLLAGAGAALLGGPGLSFAQIGLVGAAGFALLLALPALLVREPPPTEPPGPRGALLSELAAVARAHAAIFVTNGLVVMAGTAVLIVVPYVAEALLERPRAYTATLNAWLLGGIVLGAVLIGALSKRVAPRLLLLGATVTAALSLAGLAVTTAPLVAWHAGFVAVGVLALMSMVVPALLVAELADRDGRRRDGLFFGVNGAALNVGCALAALSVTALLDAGSVRGALALVAGTLALAALLLARRP